MADDFHILVAIDLKDGTDILLAEAQRYGRALDATVDIVHVAAPDPTFVGYAKAAGPDEQDWLDPEREPHARELRAEHQQTQAHGAHLRANGIRVGRVLTVQGPTAALILEEARKLAADLIILGSHHHHALYRLWHGGDTVTALVEQQRCAVLVVPVPD